MGYLDVSPLISALGRSPETFELTKGSLRHIPSRHSFRFNPNGSVRVDAACNCSFLSIRKEQEPALHEAFQEWRMNYWRPIEINREFAEHFDRPAVWRRPLIALSRLLLRVALWEPRSRRVPEGISVPAE